MTNPMVTIKQGQLKGKIESTKSGFIFNTFHGIPYAKPPLGNLRFKSPVPAEKWTGIRDATQEKEECFCYNVFRQQIMGSEDCLFINVYTPELPTSLSTPKAVMVWIHGGGFVFGSGNREQYGPEYLIEKDIVLVTLNYRLGTLGFLCLDDKSLEVTGNAGLKDQVLALRWVQENIQHFGGDPNNVTIFGESAGASSVHLHILSAMSKGLFHKAIMQSGSALCPWILGQRHGYILVENMGKEAKTDAEVLDILQNATKEELIQAQNKNQDNFIPSEIRLVSPVIEGPHDEAFLSADPLAILKSGEYNKVPMIIGFNSEEGLLIKMTKSTSKVVLDFEEAIPFTYGVPKGSGKSKEIAKKIKEFYYQSEEPNENNKHIFYKMMSDTLFVRGIFAAIEETLKTSKEQVYLYKLSLECELNCFSKILNLKEDGVSGVSHAEDLFYLFHHSLLSPEIIPGSIEDLSILRMTNWWTNFAKCGNPNGAVAGGEQEWPAVDENMPCLDINHKITIQTQAEETYMKFWQLIEDLARS